MLTLPNRLAANMMAFCVRLRKEKVAATVEAGVVWEVAGCSLGMTRVGTYFPGYWSQRRRKLRTEAHICISCEEGVQIREDSKAAMTSGHMYALGQ
jgi:hypothetical protein